MFGLSKGWIKGIALTIFVGIAIFITYLTLSSIYAAIWKAGWDAKNLEVVEQRNIDLQRREEAIANAREEERRKWVEQVENASNLAKGLEDENRNLENTLDKYRRDRRMRIVTCSPIKAGIDGAGVVSVGAEIVLPTDGEHTTRLPDDIGVGFERLREAVIRAGNRADRLARINRANQESLKIIHGQQNSEVEK